MPGVTSRFARLPLCLLAGLACSCGSSSGSGNPSPGTTTGNDGGAGSDGGAGADVGSPGHDETLAGLGVDTDLGPPVDLQGHPLPEDYNPLGATHRYLLRQAEIDIGGVTPQVTGGGGETILDDKTGGFEAMHQATRSDTWMNLWKVSTAGDFDGDGREEVSVLVINNDSTSSENGWLTLRVVEDQDDGFTVSEHTLTKAWPRACSPMPDRSTSPTVTSTATAARRSWPAAWATYGSWTTLRRTTRW